jgi:hypothetical protein
MDYIGYEFLRKELNLSSFPVRRPAVSQSVTRIEESGGLLLIPKTIASLTHSLLDHVLFALKHEGTNLQILAESLPKIDAKDLLNELRLSPTSSYVRVSCYLWEHFTKSKLIDMPDISGATANLFNPEKYITGPSVRNARWRVAFNGLGTINYCVTVEKTIFIQESIKSNILDRAKKFVSELGYIMTDRALSWAYLHETESSFAIEHENPSESKAKMFVDLLHQAHDRRKISEDYLVELQNSIVNNKYDKAAGFRNEQNWLRGSMRGAAGITYLPPPPEIASDLINELISFANADHAGIDSIIVASIVSFGFVYIHPFMDGNGRLARFLFHQSLCQSGRLENGMLLPVSVAMKRNESEYLSTLQEYSLPSREQWSVKWIDRDQYDLKFKGNKSIYQYWDATKQVEFCYRMAEQALEIELKNETEFLVRYDKITKAIDQQFDVRGSVLSTLVIMCLDNNNKLSNNRRNQFNGVVSDDVFDAIEAIAAQAENDGEKTVYRQKMR